MKPQSAEGTRYLALPEMLDTVDFLARLSQDNEDWQDTHTFFFFTNRPHSSVFKIEKGER